MFKYNAGYKAEEWANWIDRKSTRLNSSHDQISYAVFCLKKKKKFNKDPLQYIHIPRKSFCPKNPVNMLYSVISGKSRTSASELLTIADRLRLDLARRRSD